MSTLARLALLASLPWAAPAAQELTFVETAPVETTLDHAALPETHEVWLAMIGGAERTIDLAHFYASNRAGSRLESVVRALEEAAERGVAVRFLTDAGFARTYPETLDRLDARERIEVRRYDLRGMTGGAMHAKYFVVDGREAFVGSANFDWRSLEHVQELGARVQLAPVATALADVFALDWHLAGGGERGEAPAPRVGADAFPVHVEMDGGEVAVTPVFSPRGLLPDERLWDLPRIVEWIDGADTSVALQLMTYRTVGRDGHFFDTLENALRRAAARGVGVRILAADWCKRAGTIEGLQSLECLPNVEVRLTTLPQASEGFIPFARVTHAKTLVVDGRRAWIGTSNWEHGYFHDGRNVGLLLDGAAAAGTLQRFFDDGWTSDYAAPVDPGAAYEPPRIGE